MIKYFENKFEYLTIKRNVFKNLDESIINDRFMSGDYKDHLQDALKTFTGSKYCLLTKSGTQSLEVGLRCLGVGLGNYVITTPYTFIATISAIKAVGAIPLFADIDKDTWNIDPNNIEKLIKQFGKQVRCILTVDRFGNPCNYNRIFELSKHYKIPVLEDACQAFTAEYDNKTIGNISNITSISFYPTKPFGGFGEGGAFFTNYDDIYIKAKSILNHGTDGNDNCIMDGINGEFDSLHAMFLLERMKTINGILEKRNMIADLYKNMHNITMQKVEENAKSAWYRVQILNGNVDIIKSLFEIDNLYSRDICDNKLYSIFREYCNNSEQIAHNSVSMPIYYGIDVKKLQEAINQYNEKVE